MAQNDFKNEHKQSAQNENNRKFETIDVEPEVILNGDTTDEEFLTKVNDSCESILINSYNVSRAFASSDFQQVGEEAAIQLADILTTIREDNKERGFVDRMVKLLPNKAQDFVQKSKRNLTRNTISQQSVGKTTDQIFKSLEEQKVKLNQQMLDIFEMIDHIEGLRDHLITISNGIEERYLSIAEKDGFKNNKRLEYQYRSSLNNINIQIKSLERQATEMDHARIACETAQVQIKEQLPHVQQSLISGLSTSAFITNIENMQNNFQNIMKTVSEINLSNSKQNQAILIQVTDTAKYRRENIKTLELQQEVDKKTKEGIRRNFRESVEAIQLEHKALIDIDNRADKNDDGVLYSPKNNRHKTPELNIRRIQNKES